MLLLDKQHDKNVRDAESHIFLQATREDMKRPAICFQSLVTKKGENLTPKKMRNIIEMLQTYLYANCSFYKQQQFVAREKAERDHLRLEGLAIQVCACQRYGYSAEQNRFQKKFGL